MTTLATRDPDTKDLLFNVVLEQFEGPFDLLLRLISRRELDISVLSLHQVVDDFIKHLDRATPDLEVVSSFVVTAATLLDLKAAALLPAGEVDDEADIAALCAADLLVARLIQYRTFRYAATEFANRWRNNSARFPSRIQSATYRPDVTVDAEELVAALVAVLRRPRKPDAPNTGHLHAPRVSIAEQTAVLTARLRRVGSASLSDLLGPPADRELVVARFIAVLELYRTGTIALVSGPDHLIVQWSGE